MASFKAIYSASQELKATVFCNLELQDKGVPLKVKI
jgi:hypothetical protein